MSKYDKAGLAMIPSGYKDSKVYSLIPNSSNGDFDFTRGSTATRVNKDGLIDTVASGVPRLEYPLIDGVVKDTPSLLLEPSRTNLITYSEDFSDSSWTKLGAGTGTTAIVTSDYAVSPDGTQNASRLQCDLNGGLTSSANQSLIYDSITGSGDTFAFIYVKSNTSSSQNFFLANTLNDYVIGVATTEWQKFELNWIAAGNGRTISIGTRGTSNSDDTLDLLIWGAQVEAGSYPTSYIPTIGSTVTRAAETCNGAGTSAEFNDSEGVLFAEIADIKNDDGVEKRLAIQDNGTFDAVRITFTPSTNSITGVVYNNSAVQCNLVHIVNNTEDFNKIALKYKANDFALWINGIEVATDNSGTVFNNGALDKLSFDLFNNAKVYGSTKQLIAFKEELTDSELEDLTSWDSFNEMATGQLYTIE